MNRDTLFYALGMWACSMLLLGFATVQVCQSIERIKIQNHYHTHLTVEKAASVVITDPKTYDVAEDAGAFIAGVEPNNKRRATR